MENKKSGKIIFPINYPRLEGNLIFLSGPVVRAPRWQDKAIEIIKNLDSNVNIASPRYTLDFHKNYSKDNPCFIEDVPYGDGSWPEVDWQIHYRDKAFNSGCELFYLPEEEYEFDPNSKMEKYENARKYPYSMTTRAELFSRLHSTGNLVIGRENCFPGRDYIDYVFVNHRPQTRIFKTLEETCIAAVEIARREINEK